MQFYAVFTFKKLRASYAAVFITFRQFAIFRSYSYSYVGL